MTLQLQMERSSSIYTGCVNFSLCVRLGLDCAKAEQRNRSQRRGAVDEREAARQEEAAGRQQE